MPGQIRSQKVARPRPRTARCKTVRRGVRGGQSRRCKSGSAGCSSNYRPAGSLQNFFSRKPPSRIFSATNIYCPRNDFYIYSIYIQETKGCPYTWRRALPMRLVSRKNPSPPKFGPTQRHSLWQRPRRQPGGRRERIRLPRAGSAGTERASAAPRPRRPPATLVPRASALHVALPDTCCARSKAGPGQPGDQRGWWPLEK